MRLPADPLSGRDLAAFVAAVEAGSIQGAADALTLTQSAVTKRIQALERRTGVRLLDRKRTGVTATVAGRRLYPAARRTLDALAAADDAVTEGGQRPLDIAASYTIGAILLPPWLVEFRTHYRRAQPRVSVTNSLAVTRSVRSSAVEIGFVEGLDDLHALRAMTVGHDEIVAAVSADHRWATRKAVLPAELGDEPFIAREEGSGTRAVADQALAKIGVALEPIMEVSSIEAVRHALEGGGFTLISRLAVEAEIANGSLHALRIDGVQLRRQLRAISRHAPTLSKPAAAFWGWLARTHAGYGPR